jgi:hypothetical protein
LPYGTDYPYHLVVVTGINDRKFHSGFMDRMTAQDTARRLKNQARRMGLSKTRYEVIEQAVAEEIAKEFTTPS